MLFAVFFKIGLFSFGGGYAMLTLIENEIVEKRGWLTKSELTDVFIVAESTPGAIAINIATFIGTKRLGVFGGIVTTLGVVLPSFLIILGLSYVIALVNDNKWVSYLFKGIRVGVLVLIIKAVGTFFKDMKKNVFCFALMFAAFFISLFTNISVIYIILGAIVVSSLAIALVYYRKRRLLFDLSGVYRSELLFNENKHPNAVIQKISQATEDETKSLNNGNTSGGVSDKNGERDKDEAQSGGTEDNA